MSQLVPYLNFGLDIQCSDSDVLYGCEGMTSQKMVNTQDTYIYIYFLHFVYFNKYLHVCMTI